MVFGFFRVFVCHVEIYMIIAVEFHLAVYGAGDDVARRKRKPRIIFLHEFLAAKIAEHCSITAHGFGYQERGTVARMEEGCRMELDELHILDCAFGAIDHRDTVAGSDQRVGGSLIDSADTAGCHDSYL